MSTENRETPLPKWQREHVHVLTLTTRHSTDNEVYRTEEDALTGLHEYVLGYWDEEVNGRWAEDGAEDIPVPEDRDAAIAAYFEKVQDESYLIERLELRGSPAPATGIQAGEVVVPLTTGWALASGVYNPADPQARVCGEYVRLVRPDGTEAAYWDQEEWRRDPALVMGAILNSAAHGLDSD